MVDLSFVRTDTAADDRYVRRLQGSMDSLKRAQAYLQKTPGAVSGESGHNTTYRVACKLVHGFHLSDSDAMRLMAVWNSKCEPPWSDSELEHKIADARAKGTAADADQWPLPSPAAAAPPPSSRQAPPAAPVVPPLEFNDAWAAIANPEPMAEVVIEGLLRRGEVCNIIAATKKGKSWLGLQLLLAVSTGGDWLGLRCRRGRTLLIDNELHRATLQNRLHDSAGDMAAGEACEYVNLRGQWRSLTDVAAQLTARYQPGELTLLLLDAKYRFFGGELDENSNSAQTQFHNDLDRLAMQLNCAIAVVHHSTKGSQAEKSVTDMGAGGGAQARAVDLHATIRDHSIPGLSVLEMKGRSFPELEPRTLRFEYPHWHVQHGVAPRLTKPSESDEKYQQLKPLLTNEWQTLHKLAEACDTRKDRKCFKEAVQKLIADGVAERTNEFKPPKSSCETSAIRLVPDPDRGTKQPPA